MEYSRGPRYPEAHDIRIHFCVAAIAKARCDGDVRGRLSANGVDWFFFFTGFAHRPGPFTPEAYPNVWPVLKSAVLIYLAAG